MPTLGCDGVREICPGEERHRMTVSHDPLLVGEHLTELLLGFTVPVLLRN